MSKTPEQPSIYPADLERNESFEGLWQTRPFMDNSSNGKAVAQYWFERGIESQQESDHE